jgi:hypothetical protein
MPLPISTVVPITFTNTTQTPVAKPRDLPVRFMIAAMNLSKIGASATLSARRNGLITLLIKKVEP